MLGHSICGVGDPSCEVARRVVREQSDSEVRCRGVLEVASKGGLSHELGWRDRPSGCSWPFNSIMEWETASLSGTPRSLIAR